MSTPVKIILFPGLASWNVWIGQSQGFYEREGLDLQTTPTMGSVDQFRRLSAGEFDLAFTAFDNLVAYNEGQGEVSLENPPDFACILGGDGGFLGLYTRPEIGSYDDLRGKNLVVDAVNTGFSFVLRKMLSAKGLGGNDYTLVPVGNTQKRMEKMLAEDDHVAGLLTPPLDAAAVAKGLKLLARATDVLGQYQAGCAIASRTWLEVNSDTAVRFIRAHVSAINWLLTPENKDAALRLLIDNAKMEPQAAAATYTKALDPATGFSPDGAINVPGIQTVLDLRAEYGVPKKTLGTPQKYYDDHFYRAAIR